MYLIGTQFRDFGETVFRDLIHKANIQQGIKFRDSAVINFLFFSKSLNLLEFFLHLTFSIPYVKSLQINDISQ